MWYRFLADMSEIVFGFDNLAATLDRVVRVASLRGYVAMSLGGSTQAGFADQDSDLDIHVLWEPPLAEPEERAALIRTFADPGSVRVDVRSWGLEDHFTIEGTGVELIYVHLGDMLAHTERAYHEGLTEESFTTALLYNFATGRRLYDPNGVLTRLQERLNRDFPEATRSYLLRHHSPLMAYYWRLMQNARLRGDLLFAQSMGVGLHTLFFNLLFTLNREYHPGGKRLLLHSRVCALRPVDSEARWDQIARLPVDDPRLDEMVAALVAELIDLIRQHGGVEVADVYR